MTLAVLDFKVRYFGSALGYFWQLMRPLMLFGVLFIVFTEFVKFNEGVKFFPAYLLTAIMLFTFFADATGGAVTSVLDRENLVRKIQFPRVVIPLASVLTAIFNLLTNLVAVGVLVLATGVRPMWTWLLVPFLIGALCVLATGMAMLLSALYVRFRDVEPIWEVVAPGALLRLADPVRDRDRAERHRAPGDHVQPDRDDPPAGPPLVDRPGRPERPRRSGAGR